MPLITDPVFYLVAIPAVLLLGMSKSGFGAGFAASGGGGGWGDPYERDPERVRMDVLDGYIEPAAARDLVRRTEHNPTEVGSGRRE